MTKYEEIALSPAAGAYWLVIKTRNWLFDKGIFKTKKFPVPIVSVGNITAGGTGKTPMVAFLADNLKAHGQKVAIVSRGYKGSYTSEAEKVDPLRGDAAAVYGDEPTWFAHRCQVPVYVGRERVKAIELCIKNENPQVILADDGFQHRWFYRNQDIVLLDVTEESVGLLPVGRWREPFTALKRAGIVVLTKADQLDRDKLSLWEEVVGDQGFYYSNKNLFKAWNKLQSIFRVTGTQELKEGDPVMLGSSIARPESFGKLIERHHPVLKHWVLPDHGDWTQSYIDEIEKYASQKKCPHLLVTEKDFVKLKGREFIDLNVWVCRMSLEFEPGASQFLERVFKF